MQIHQTSDRGRQSLVDLRYHASLDGGYKNKVVSILGTRTVEGAQAVLTLDDLVNNGICNGEACLALRLNAKSTLLEFCQKPNEKPRTRLKTSVMVIKMSATHEVKNQTSAGV